MTLQLAPPDRSLSHGERVGVRGCAVGEKANSCRAQIAHRAVRRGKLLWSRLRNRQLGAKFVRQFPIGNYIADFASRSARLVIELDGGQHDEALDAARTQSIDADGFRVIRFWNHEVIENTDGVVEAITEALSLAR